MEGHYHGQRQTARFLWKEGLKASDIYRRLSAICVGKALARSTVFHCVRRFNSGKETAQTAVREWYRSTLQEWFRAAIRKLSPSDWQRCVT